MRKLYGGLPKTKLPKTWEDAARSGSKYFYTRKPCKNGHMVPRYTRSGACMECTKEGVYRWREMHPEQYRKKQREWAAKHRKENREAVRKYNREYRRKQRAAGGK